MRADPVETTVIDVLLDYLEGEGVQHIFGVPGGPLTPFFEALRRRGTIEFVLAKHEEGAAFMANAYARVRNGLGVCCVTSGPGATNAISGVAGALGDSLPVLYITGQVALQTFGRGAIQESTVHGVDVVAILRPITKLSTMLVSAASAPEIIRTAIRTSLAGRRGPVHLSVPSDLAKAKVSLPPIAKRPYRPSAAASMDRGAVTEAIELLLNAKKPCLFVGNGVALADATEELRTFVERLKLPVATSPKGKGAFPEDHPLSLGVFGLGGHTHAQEYMLSEDVDVLCVIGSSLNEFSSSAWERRLQPTDAFIHVDIDPTEIGKNYPVDVAVVGDAKATLHSMNGYLTRIDRLPQHDDVITHLRKSIPRFENSELLESDSSPIAPPRLVKEIRDALPEDGMIFVDNGNSICWGGHYFEIRKSGTYFIDLGLACMGSAVASLVGGKIARPNSAAVALVGDAAFAMHGMEVHTAVEQRLPVTWVVLNNGGHGMVTAGERLLRGEDLGFGTFRVPIDAAALGKSLGARSFRVDTPKALREALREGFACGEPVVIDAIIDPNIVPPTLKTRADSLARFFSGSKS